MSFGRMSEEDAQYLIENADFMEIYDAYDRLPDDFQQYVDLMIDYGFVR